MKHTHRGTCQVCGAVQAITAAARRRSLDPNVIAAHGYTVEWGYFHGVCSGSNDKPLEHDKTHTEAIIKMLRETHAPVLDQRAADLKSGAIEPTFHKRVKNEKPTCFRDRYVDVECSRADLSDYDAKQQIAAAIYRAESDARNARSHASMLEKLIEARFGQPLYPVKDEDRKTLAAGSKVQIGGKKGPICEVIEIRDQVASGCGPYLNGRIMAHAIVRAVGGRLIAIPVRSIRQSAIIENAQ